ncbi:unnamed protein product [Miscanthus lutarioriparius]|uniref:NADP-dependent oxidoreductase domain-containing protein n=1 Tax=Miscanthus lutarioriparius TaxID=422564 RepID=A0A811S3I4_9POAL|nr:unnamed protein product [Miscanthus lutarioriparius]
MLGLGQCALLWISENLWNSDHGHALDACKDSFFFEPPCKDSLKKLQLDYLDLYLIHFPVATRHTGVGTTSSALGDDGVLFHWKQHGMQWKNLFPWDWCAALESAHTPLGGSTANTEWFGSVSCLDDPVIKGLAEKYGKTPVLLVLWWGLQRNTVVIPMTSKAQ